MPSLEKLIERGEGVALESGTPSPAQMVAVLSIAYRISIDTPIDFWEIKLMPRTRYRMRCWPLSSI